jgi:hypothetical protein
MAGALPEGISEVRPLPAEGFSPPRPRSEPTHRPGTRSFSDGGTDADGASPIRHTLAREFAREIARERVVSACIGWPSRDEAVEAKRAMNWVNSQFMALFSEHPQRDSNPCRHLERVVS